LSTKIVWLMFYGWMFLFGLGTCFSASSELLRDLYSFPSYVVIFDNTPKPQSVLERVSLFIYD